MSPKKRKIPKWLKVILIIIVAIVLFFVVVINYVDQSTKNAVKVSNQFISDMQTNNDSAAYSLTSPDFQKVTTSAQLAKALNGVSPYLQGTPTVVYKTINKLSGQPSQSTINYTLQTSKGTKYIQVVLQDNNPWQILNFQSSSTPFATPVTQ
jgi:predicted PurR-regulated permease PerM